MGYFTYPKTPWDVVLGVKWKPPVWRPQEWGVMSLEGRLCFHRRGLEP